MNEHKKRINKLWMRILIVALCVVMAFGTTVTIMASSFDGDLDGDGKITAYDAQLLAEYQAGHRDLDPATVIGLTVRGIIDRVLGKIVDEPTLADGIEKTFEVKTEEGVVTKTETFEFDIITVTVPEGTKVTGESLTVTVKQKSASEGGLTLEDGQELLPLDIHVEGVAADNTTPIVICVGGALDAGMNLGNVTLYHVENGVANPMTQVMSAQELTAHNNFYYDPATGDITVAMATFSEVAVVSDTDKGWEGRVDHSWYVGKKSPYTIANADQLWSFSQIVGGMAEGIEQDSFAGKTVQLIADINLNDLDSEDGRVFYPIGYNSDDGEYEKTGVKVSTGFYTFEGTFDGQGHTIANFYHNTWEMKGDNNYYDATLQYYRDGMGLFGKVYGGTVKNLTVENFSSDGEYTTTGVIAAYADCGATFENIAIFNCNPRVYNIGNGGIVGCVGWYAKETTENKVTFRNITVDNSNKISALWGSYDVACGGIVGQYYPTSGQSSANYPVNAGIYFENCHVAAVMDVYNDVCANYQYYAYRYTGMLIGSIRENVTGEDGHVYPKMDGIEAKGCTVHFGDWNDYYYCELVANSLASYTHDHQMSRLEQVASVDVENKTVTTLKGATVAIPESGRVNYVVVKAKDTDGLWIHGDGHDYAECYHFVNGVQHFHDIADSDNPNPTETVDGVEGVLKEDKQLVYREFDQLFTGYGWGVTSKGIGDLDGVTILDRKEGSSVVKFEGTGLISVTTGKPVAIGTLFAAKNNGVELKPENIQVAVNDLDETDGTVTAVFVNNADNWTEGTLTFTGSGRVEITIQDYYFCTPTTITVEVKDQEPVEKFDLVFENTEKYMYRVGNMNTVTLSSLFKANEGVKIGTVSVTVEPISNGVSGEYKSNATWTNGTIQFTGTGVVKVIITDNDYCIPTELYLEVVDAKNATSAINATENNVVLLQDCGISSLTVSDGYTFYGNGFTLSYGSDGRYLGKGSGFKFGIINISEGGTLDNCRVVCSVYPVAALYSDQISDYSETDASGKTRYFYQLSAVAISGNSTISNCYIYGGRNNVHVGDGNVKIENSIFENGTLANIEIQSGDSYTVTLENVTTIQHQVNATIGNTSAVMLGAGVIVNPETNNNPTIVLNGDFKQYNWVTKADQNAVSDSTATMIINTALSATEFNHTVNGVTASNLGIIFLNEYTINITNHTGLPYASQVVTMMTEKGQVYSLKNANADQMHTNTEDADKSTLNGYYMPQFAFADDLGGQKIPDDGGDEFCYAEGKTVRVMFPSGDTKELDLAGLVDIAKYSGQDLNLQITCKDANGNAVDVDDGKIKLSTAGDYTVTYSVTDTVFYDKDGNTVAETRNYSWMITVSVTLKNTAIENAYFAFDETKQVIYRSGNSNIKQFIPFLAGLKIYDYNGPGQEAYLRFDGDTNFTKIAKATINNVNTTGEAQGYHIVTVELTDGGKLVIDMDVRANSGSSTHSGSIKVRNNVLYVVNGGTTSGKGQTWTIYSYKFVGNNGTEINSGKVTFGTAGVDCDTATTPSSNFGTTIKYTVTYDANGGDCGQTVGYATSASAAVTLPTPRRSGYMFLGWHTAAEGGTKEGGVGDSYTPTANITLYAQWGKPCTVTYDANGGNCDTTSEKYNGDALTLPTPTRDGYWFIGWYDAATGGNFIGDAGKLYHATGEITMYAHWQEAVAYTVTYNANSGECSTVSATYEGTALILPTPTKTGYKFLGWYTAASGGAKEGDAGANYIPSGNITLYAQWEKIAYTITYSKTEVSSSTGPATAYYGDNVTVTVVYNEAQKSAPTIKGNTSGNAVTVTSSGSGKNYTYTFTMPAEDVTMTLTGDSCITGDTLITLADGSQVRVDALTGNEELLVWNLETGRYDAAPIVFVDTDAEAEYEVINLNFSDGSSVGVIYEHGFFDYKLGEYVYIDAANAQSYVGHRFVTQGDIEAGTWSTAILTSVEIEKKVEKAYSPVTFEHLCYFTDGVLSMPGGISGLFNIFEVDTSVMAYDAQKKAADIAKYGLFTLEDFGGMITEEAFYAFNGAYLKVAMAKGLLTWEDIAYMAERYIPLV